MPSCLVVKNGMKISSWLSLLIGSPSLITLIMICSERLISAVISIFFATCERLVDFPQDNSGKIHINAIVAGADSRINVMVSQPLNGTESVTADKIRLILDADGESVTLIRDLDYAASYPGEVSYVTDIDFEPGQNLKLIAEAEGLPSVVAHTTIPAKLPVPAIECERMSAHMKKDPELVTDHLEEIFKFRITLDEPVSENSYFAVQMYVRKFHEYTGNVNERAKEYYDSLSEEGYDDIFVNSEMIENLALSSQKVDLIIDYEGGEMKVMTALQVEDKSVLEIPVKATEKRLLIASYGQNPEDQYEIYECFEYKVKVCRLSAELYHCFKARYIADNSDAPIHLGFSPVSYTYTNVEGGLGIFGAMSVYESDWKYYEN